MSEGLFLPDGLYETPHIGQLSRHNYPESALIVENGALGVRSALYGDKKFVHEIFRDPRAANFVDTVLRQQFHHLDTRQLSLPERFETRAGAGRMNRLTTLVESARLVAELGGTFEQVAQVMVSDINVTLGSHRLGDHLAGDYASQTTRDNDILDYIHRSGLFDALVSRHVVTSQGGLSGSPTTLAELSNPNRPRRRDIVEAPRPDSNADRDPFTLFEALYLYDQKLVNEAVRSVVRAEIPVSTGDTEERLAYTDIDAARLLYEASVRHVTEHWGNPEHHLIEEIVSSADKYRLLSLWPYSPIDYARTSESEWFDTAGNGTDDFAPGILLLAEDLAKRIREATWAVQSGQTIFKGPGKQEIPGITFRKLSETIARPTVKVARDTRYDAGARLTVHTPANKRRRPIDPLVIGPHGMERLTMIEPELIEYAERQMRHLGSYAITVEMPWDTIGQFKKGFEAVNYHWSPKSGMPEPMLQTPMDKQTLTRQIARAREVVIGRSRVGAPV